MGVFSFWWVWKVKMEQQLQQQQQQQPSHLSQVFGVGYMNQRELRRIGHMDQLSPLITIEQYAFTKTFSLYILSYITSIHVFFGLPCALLTCPKLIRSARRTGAYFTLSFTQRETKSKEHKK